MPAGLINIPELSFDKPTNAEPRARGLAPIQISEISAEIARAAEDKKITIQKKIINLFIVNIIINVARGYKREKAEKGCR
jgi:hypothetical protein